LLLWIVSGPAYESFLNQAIAYGGDVKIRPPCRQICEGELPLFIRGSVGREKVTSLRDLGGLCVSAVMNLDKKTVHRRDAEDAE